MTDVHHLARYINLSYISKLPGLIGAEHRDVRGDIHSWTDDLKWLPICESIFRDQVNSELVIPKAFESTEINKLHLNFIFSGQSYLRLDTNRSIIVAEVGCDNT